MVGNMEFLPVGGPGRGTGVDQEMQPHLCCCEQTCPAPQNDCVQNGFNNTSQNISRFLAGNCAEDTSHAKVSQLKLTGNKI